MAKGKTTKYYIEFSGTEVLNSIPIELTKTAFKKHFDEYTKQADENEKNKDEQPEFYIHRFTKEYKRNHYTEVCYFFNIGCADIVLSKRVADEGYFFTR